MNDRPVIYLCVACYPLTSCRLETNRQEHPHPPSLCIWDQSPNCRFREVAP